MLNIKDVEKYSRKGITEANIRRKLDQEEELVKELYDLQYVSSWKTYEQYIKDYSYKKVGSGHHYRLTGIHKSGDIVTKFEVVEMYYQGLKAVIDYKGNTYVFEALKDGTICECALMYGRFRNSSNYKYLYNFNSLEEIVSETLKILKKDKREIMNHYNKLIKDTKQDYKQRLNKIKDSIKQTEEAKQ